MFCAVVGIVEVDMEGALCRTYTGRTRGFSVVVRCDRQMIYLSFLMVPAEVNKSEALGCDFGFLWCMSLFHARVTYFSWDVRAFMTCILDHMFINFLIAFLENINFFWKMSTFFEESRCLHTSLIWAIRRIAQGKIFLTRIYCSLSFIAWCRR